MFIFLCLFIMKTHIYQEKNGLVRHINVFTPEVRELGFHQVLRVNKTCTQGSNTCEAVSSYCWNGQRRWVVKLVLFVCRSISYSHFRNLIWAPVPYHCLFYPCQAVILLAFLGPNWADSRFWRNLLVLLKVMVVLNEQIDKYHLF